VKTKYVRAIFGCQRGKVYEFMAREMSVCIVQSFLTLADRWRDLPRRESIGGGNYRVLRSSITSFRCGSKDRAQMFDGRWQSRAAECSSKRYLS